MSRELHFNICGMKTSHFSDLSRARLGTQEDESAEREMPSEDMLTTIVPRFKRLRERGAQVRVDALVGSSHEGPNHGR